MKIRIQKISDDLYMAELFDLSPGPHLEETEWKTPAPMGPLDLCSELQARGCDSVDISDAFEKADPDLVPTPQEHVPIVGEEIMLTNHFGSFMVEEVDADAKTASVRVLRSGILIKDVEWSRIWPLNDETRQLIKQIAAGEAFDREVLRKLLRGKQRLTGE